MVLPPILNVKQLHGVLRSYPRGFGLKLLNLWEEARYNPRVDMRQKVPLDAQQSDLEIFNSLEVGDVWCEAGLPSIFIYMMESERCKGKIPPGWVETLMELKEEMRQYVL